MQNQNTITTAFVFIVGLLGGYMIAQHVGHAAESHNAQHEAQRVDTHHDDMPHDQEVQAGVE